VYTSTTNYFLGHGLFCRAMPSIYEDCGPLCICCHVPNQTSTCAHAVWHIKPRANSDYARGPHSECCPAACPSFARLQGGRGGMGRADRWLSCAPHNSKNAGARSMCGPCCRANPNQVHHSIPPHDHQDSGRLRRNTCRPQKTGKRGLVPPGHWLTQWSHRLHLAHTCACTPWASPPTIAQLPPLTHTTQHLPTRTHTPTTTMYQTICKEIGAAPERQGTPQCPASKIQRSLPQRLQFYCHALLT
jgi:hypothetical protein